jgi:hypothetical protein
MITIRRETSLDLAAQLRALETLLYRGIAEPAKKAEALDGERLGRSPPTRTEDSLAILPVADSSTCGER